ncbi:unnamed protein product [marine sediment metagenome]|uniref:Uncharacterized protein n=1 Tax=marine sediment metagenome TaxID=412755 RepID=X1G7E5_9ZZZZ
MHPYSIDIEERKNILLILAIVSIVFSWSFYKILGYYQFSLPWWIEGPSVLFFYGLLFIIFDKWLWQYLKKINIVKTPNLNGEWNGNLKSSFDNHLSEVKATLKIFQTWTRIKILLTTDQSSSHSESASIVIDAPEGKYLSYQYINDPKSNAVGTMSIHRGTVRLIFDEKKSTLEGEYYSGRGRQNYGSLYFVRNNIN